MWWAGTETRALYLGQHAGVLRVPGSVPSAVSAARWQDVLMQLDASVRSASARPASWQVWLGSQLAPPFVLPAPEGLRNDAEARAAAQTLAAAAFAMDGACEVWLDPWRSGEPLVGAIVSTEVLHAVRSRLAGRRGQRLSIQPWWAAALRAALAADSAVPWWAGHEPDGLTYLAGEGTHVTTASVHSQSSTQAPAAHLARLRLQSGMAMRPGRFTPWPALMPCRPEEHDAGEVRP